MRSQKTTCGKTRHLKFYLNKGAAIIHSAFFEDLNENEIEEKNHVKRWVL